MDLQFFQKNVNKQLKSADFFLRCQNFKNIHKQKLWQFMFSFLNIPHTCKSIEIRDTMAKSLILLGPLL